MYDVKDYLNQIRFINQEIQSRIEERNELREAVAIKSPKITADKVQESGNLNYDDKYMKFIEASEVINEKIDEMINLKMQISNEIDRLEKPEHRLILRLRYINLKSYEEISVAMCYDIRQIHRMHGSALQEFVSKCHRMSQD